VALAPVTLTVTAIAVKPLLVNVNRLLALVVPTVWFPKAPVPLIAELRAVPLSVIVGLTPPEPVKLKVAVWIHGRLSPKNTFRAVGANRIATVQVVGVPSAAAGSRTVPAVQVVDAPVTIWNCNGIAIEFTLTVVLW
jgi:hypothetical protein